MTTYGPGLWPDAWPLEPVQQRIVFADLCGRYGPGGCICHLDRDHLAGAGGAELEHDCGHCRWSEAESVSQLQADARLVQRARAAGVPEPEIREAVRIGPVDGDGCVLVDIDLSRMPDAAPGPGPLRRLAERLGLS